MVWLSLGAFAQYGCAKAIPEVHVIPADFRGPVVVAYGCSTATPSPFRDGVYTLNIPESGVLFVPEPFGNIRTPTFLCAANAGHPQRLPFLVRGDLPKAGIVSTVLRSITGGNEEVAEGSGKLGVYRLTIRSWYEGQQQSTVSPNRTASVYCVGSPVLDGDCAAQLESRLRQVEELVRERCGPPA